MKAAYRKQRSPAGLQYKLEQDYAVFSQRRWRGTWPQYVSVALLMAIMGAWFGSLLQPIGEPTLARLPTAASLDIASLGIAKLTAQTGKFAALSTTTGVSGYSSSIAPATGVPNMHIQQVTHLPIGVENET